MGWKTLLQVHSRETWKPGRTSWKRWVMEMYSCIGLGYFELRHLPPISSSPSILFKYCLFKDAFLTNSVLYWTCLSLIFVTHSATKSETASTVNGFLCTHCPYIINCLRDKTVSYIVHCLSSRVSTLLRTGLTLKIHWTKGYPAFGFCSKDFPKFNAHGTLLSVIGSLDGRGVWGAWIRVYVWLSPFAVHLKPSGHCSLAIPQYKQKYRSISIPTPS